MKKRVFHKIFTNYLIFGDIHGRYLELKKICEMCPNSIPVSVGDLMDRGPDSKKVLDFFMEKGLAVLGNHDHMMIDFYRNKKFYVSYCWFWNGAHNTLLSFTNNEKEKELINNNTKKFLELEKEMTALPKEQRTTYLNEIGILIEELRSLMQKIVDEKYIIFLESLPKFIETDDFIITHAPINPSIPFKSFLDEGKNDAKTDRSFLWNRGGIRKQKKIQFHGHNSNRKPRIFVKGNEAFAINLDSSKGEILTAYDGESDTLISVPWEK